MKPALLIFAFAAAGIAIGAVWDAARIGSPQPLPSGMRHLPPVGAVGTSCIAPNSKGKIVMFPSREGICYSVDAK